VSLKSNPFFALLDSGGRFKEVPMGAQILLTDAAGFLSPSKSSAAKSEDLSTSSTLAIDGEPQHNGRRQMHDPLHLCS
jgi:hypothetical protein